MNTKIVITNTINAFLRSIGRVLKSIYVISSESQSVRTSPPMLRKRNLASRPKKGTFCPTMSISLTLLIINLIMMGSTYNEYTD